MVAKELIDFDREFSRLFSARASRSGDNDNDAADVDPTKFQQYFIAQGGSPRASRPGTHHP